MSTSQGTAEQHGVQESGNINQSHETRSDALKESEGAHAHKPACPAQGSMPSDEQARQARLERAFVMHTFARKPVCFTRGEGMKLYDDTGKEYLDFIAGIGVCSLGHCHPAVVEALDKQIHSLIHVSNYYYIEGRGELGHLISRLLSAGQTDSSTTCPKRRALQQGKTVACPKHAKPESEIPVIPCKKAQDPEACMASSTRWVTFFANSGAEANECAIKLARLYARKAGNKGTKIVTLDGSFHGRTMETLAATAQPAKQEAFQPLPEGFLHTPINDEDALVKLVEEHGSSICAIMFECIQGESGVHPCTPEFLQKARELADSIGALLIADEVQTGIFRTGSPFAFQQFGITPDIVSMAKGIASGFPMGACAAHSEIAAAFEPGDHGSTFGGSNLAIVSARTTLRTLLQGHYDEHADFVGAYLRRRLSELPHVCEVRGLGLMVACDLDESISAHDVVNRGLESGLVLNATSPHTLRFLPPLICETEEIDTLMEKLGVLLNSSRQEV